jgi:hypothetical protein
MSTDTAGRASRRAILTAAAGGAAALAVSSLAKPFPAAAAAGNMQTETDNPTVAPTGVTNSTADSGGLFGSSGTGYGIQGVSSDISQSSVREDNVGVIGAAGAVPSGFSKGPSGVYGWSPTSEDPDTVGTGVWGDSDDIGVYGLGSVGVMADAYGNGWSLVVLGRAEFSRSGRATISSGAASKTVNLAGCTSSTLVFAMLASNRSGRYVRAVVPATGSFKIYLNSSVSSKTNVVWIAFTNPSNHAG